MMVEIHARKLMRSVLTFADPRAVAASLIYRTALSRFLESSLRKSSRIEAASDFFLGALLINLLFELYEIKVWFPLLINYRLNNERKYHFLPYKIPQRELLILSFL